MVPAERLARFVSTLAVLYGLFIVPWPGLPEGYAAAYRAAGNLAFGSFGVNGVVHFLANQPVRDGIDTRVILARRGVEIGNVVEDASRLQAYLPTAAIVALILATPIPWARRLTALLGGLLGIHGFIAMRMLITMLYHFEGQDPWCLYALNPWWSHLLYGTYEVIVRSPTTSFLIPVLLWIPLCFRRRDSVRAGRTSRAARTGWNAWRAVAVQWQKAAARRHGRF